MTFRGIWTALVTPFTKDAKIDLPTFKKLLHLQLQVSIDGLVLLGTTAETPTLTPEEKTTLVQTTKNFLKNHHPSLPLMIGVGTASTTQTLQNALKAQTLGADALLVVTPYYNKPSQSGLLDHFLYVADRISIPMFLYHVPSRTHVFLEPETISKLAQHPNIVGIKEASGNLTYLAKVQKKLQSTLDKKKFYLFSGDDLTSFSFFAMGGDGIISVSSHLVAKAMKKMFQHIQEGDLKNAHELFLKLFPVFETLFIETNPVPVKTALSFLNIGNAKVRSPLAPLLENHQTKLQEVLIQCRSLLDLPNPFVSAS